MAAADNALLAFRIAERRFALDASNVAEVASQPPVTRVPHAPPSLMGVASLRGRVLPVISLGHLLGVESSSANSGRMIVLQGAEPIGLVVDQVIGLEAGEARGLVETEGGAARMVALDQILKDTFAEGLGRAKIRPAPAASAETQTPADTAAFLAFRLAGQPYALSLDHVREVIAVPDDVAALPHTDAAMLGVTLLRGALTPIVSTRVLLGLAPAPLAVASRIVLARVGEARIGLAVDEVTAIVSAPRSAIGPVPKVLNRGAGEARVASMLKTGGSGLISLLEPQQLFAEESVAQILEEGPCGDDADAKADDAAQDVLRILVFELGGETYGMDIAAVEEVAALPEHIARVPRAPAYLLGLMNLRGGAVPVIDQRQRFGAPAAADEKRPRVIITRIGDLVAGFAVDAVTQIIETTSDRVTPTPELTEEGARLFDRVARIEDEAKVILLVNSRELLDSAERDLLAALAAEAPSS